ncbi:hypothetical protein BHE74_00032884 [Ensete ventricosum]|nr:hypothetical protein BHE74_00032884 [Ensete ventricosum]
MEIEGGRVTGSGRRIGKGRSERRERRRRHMAGEEGGGLRAKIAALLFVRGGGSGGPCRRHRRQRLRIPRQGDRQKGHPRRRSHGRQAPTRPTRKVSL